MESQSMEPMSKFHAVVSPTACAWSSEVERQLNISLKLIPTQQNTAQNFERPFIKHVDNFKEL